MRYVCVVYYISEPDGGCGPAILGTYTNLENHPRLIRARETRPEPKIRLDPRTGIPSTDQPQQEKEDDHDHEESDDDGDHREFK